MMTFQNAGVKAAQAIDRWSWWRQALKDPTQIGKTLLASPSDPELGFYRTRRKDGQWEPVGIWLDADNNMVAFRDNRPVDPIDVWTWCLRQPVTREAYVKATEGGGWDDEPPAPIGDNSGSSDPFEALRIELAGEAEQASEFLKSEVKNQADADRAGIWAKRLADISKRADGEREREKAPHLAASRAVDDKWRPVVGDAKDLAAKLKKHVEPYLLAQKRAEEARQRKAQEEAEAARRAAAEAARRANESDQQSEQQREAAQREAARQAEIARAAEAEAEARKVNAGRTGARVSLRTEKVAVVTDYGKAAAALVAMKHPDMIAEIDRLAQRAAKAGLPFDGMEIKTEERVV